MSTPVNQKFKFQATTWRLNMKIKFTRYAIEVYRRNPTAQIAPIRMHSLHYRDMKYLDMWWLFLAWCLQPASDV